MTGIASANTVAEVARLIGDAARANMLLALMGGQALAAGELALSAGITAQTASGHLAKLVEVRLVAVEKQGRHRYYRLASPEIADVLHALMSVAAAGPARHRPPGPRDEALRLARTCYDHMAGRLAVALAEALQQRGHVAFSEGAALVTDEGRRFFCDFGLDLSASGPSRRALCRACLDWSERRPHIAGRLGAGLLGRVLELGWVARVPGGRALGITPAGERGFEAAFGLPAGWREPRAPRSS